MEPSRRQFFRTVSAGAAGLTLGARAAAPSFAAPAEDDEGPVLRVLVSLHGGGFVNGNGIEQDGYNGESFARLGDVVCCSLNHRLGSFGYCDQSGVGGERFAASGNVGMLDIVAADGETMVLDDVSEVRNDPDREARKSLPPL